MFFLKQALYLLELRTLGLLSLVGGLGRLRLLVRLGELRLDQLDVLARGCHGEGGAWVACVVDGVQDLQQ